MENLVLLTAMGPPASGKTLITPRMIRHLIRLFILISTLITFF